jgi:hypothetical protein
VLDDAGLGALAGILERQHWETWLLSMAGSAPRVREDATSGAIGIVRSAERRDARACTLGAGRTVSRFIVLDMPKDAAGDVFTTGTTKNATAASLDEHRLWKEVGSLVRWIWRDV